VEDLTTAEIDCRICDLPQGFAVLAEEGRLDQGGQAFHRGDFGRSRIPTDKELQFRQTAQLIQAPDLTAITQGGWLGEPAQKPMHRRVHPSGDTNPMVETLIAANAAAQQFAEQQLFGEAHWRI
jgi:hypothetical protein